jgi:hypothetical protein
MMTKSYLKLFFKSCDIAGSEINLNYKGNSTIKTVLGGILSLILIIFTLFCISYFGADLIQREKPISRFYKEFHNQSIVNLTDFPLLMTFASNTGNPITNVERYLTIDNLYYVIDLDYVTKKQVSQVYYLYSEPCNENHYSKYKDLIEKDSNVPLTVSYCINPHKINYLNGIINENDNVFAQNDFSNVPSNFVVTLVHTCKNSTRNNNSCAPPSEIDKFISDGSFLSVFYIDNYVNLNFFDAPHVSFVNNFVQAISKGMSKANHMKVKNTNIYTDSGVILEDIQEKHFHQVEDISIDILSPSDNLLLLYFETTRMSDNYYRKYVKLQDLIANIGGLIKFLFTLTSIILSVYTDKYKLIDISNSLFKVRRVVNTENNTNNALLVKSDPRIITPINTVLANKIQQDMKTRGRNLDINLMDYVKAQFKCKSKYTKMHYASLDALINNNLDIMEIIRCILKVDKLVEKVFNVNEVKLLNDKALLMMNDQTFIKDIKVYDTEKSNTTSKLATMMKDCNIIQKMYL